MALPRPGLIADVRDNDDNEYDCSRNADAVLLQHQQREDSV
jgi:hypothetical protein